jgi:hypothetical protein
MKHIRKFNENVDEEKFDIESIKQCFSDLTDEFDIKIEDKSFKEWHGKNEDKSTDVHCLQITIDLPKLNGRVSFLNDVVRDIEREWGFGNHINDLIKASSDLNKIFSGVNIAISRLSGEYPEYKFDNNFVDQKLKSRVLYRTESDSQKPKFIITITK